MANSRTSQADSARADRAMSDRPATEDRAISDEERMEAFRSSHHQAALPDLPKIDGWHTVWLSTDNRWDPIHKRMNLGYVPLKPEDCVAWDMSDAFIGKSGQYAGHIVWNEMVAFKLPMRLYEMYMRESHDTRPLALEAGIKSRMTEARMGTTAVVRDGEDEGFEQLGKKRPTPNFGVRHG